MPTRANHHLQLFLSFVHFVFPCLEHFMSSMVAWTYLTLALGFDSYKAWYQRASDNLSLTLVFFPYSLSFQPLWARSVSWSDLNNNCLSFSFTHHQKSDMVIEKASDVYRKWKKYFFVLIFKKLVVIFWPKLESPSHVQSIISVIYFMIYPYISLLEIALLRLFISMDWPGILTNKKVTTMTMSFFCDL